MAISSRQLYELEFALSVEDLLELLNMHENTALVLVIKYIGPKTSELHIIASASRSRVDKVTDLRIRDLRLNHFH